MALPITNSQSQTATQSPQGSVQAPAGGSQTSNVQPNSTSGLLNGPGSVVLHPTDLTTVNLNNSRSSTTTSTARATQAAKPHHVNGVFLSFAIVIVVAAAILAWITSRSARRSLI